MKFWNYLTKKFRIILSVALLAGLLSQFIIPAEITQAESPRFNFLPGDFELIRGADKSKGETIWHNPVNGSAGDTFGGIIYVHNGNLDTIAHNTKVKINLPSQTTNKSVKITASISADNAPTVTSTVVNGQIVGLDGLEVNLDQDAQIEFVPGSVKWFPNFTSDTQPNSALLFGQTGDEITSSGGLNIGDVNACWQFVHFVTFEFRAKANALPANIVKSKLAKNLTSGIEGTDIQANPGDSVRYTLKTTNNGGTATNVAVEDGVADVLELSEITNISDAGAVFTGTGSGNDSEVVRWPSVTINPGETLVRSFEVKIKNPLPNNPESGFHFDFIMFNVFGNEVFVRLPRPTPGQSNLAITKQVRNVTTNETNFVKANQANPGDTLEYKINFSNTGTAPADSVVLSDTLPANVQFRTGTTLISRNGGAEQTFADGITTSGINIGTLSASDTGYVKFRVSVASGLANGQTLTNTGFLKSGDTTISDTAQTSIVVPAAVSPVSTTPTLPKTGAETGVLSFLLTFSGGVFATYRKYKKNLEQKIKNS